MPKLLEALRHLCESTISYHIHVYLYMHHKRSSSVCIVVPVAECASQPVPTGAGQLT